MKQGNVFIAIIGEAASINLFN